MNSQGLTVSLNHKEDVLGAVYLTPGDPSAVIGGVPSADIVIPRRGFEHVGRMELALTLSSRDKLRITRLRSLSEVRLEGGPLDEHAVLAPGTYQISIGPTPFMLSVQIAFSGPESVPPTPH